MSFLWGFESRLAILKGLGVLSKSAWYMTRPDSDGSYIEVYSEMAWDETGLEFSLCCEVYP